MVVNEMSEAVTDDGVDNEIEVRKLQSTGRVDIPEEMHKEMGVEEGEKVFVKWNSNKDQIEIMPADPDRLD